MEIYPPMTILLKTWQGPKGQSLARNRLESAEKMLSSIKRHLKYPNYSWHIADDGSESWYQDEIHDLFKGENYTFTDTKADGDIGLNINTGMRVVLKRADYILHWSDDIVLKQELDIKSCVTLLHDYDDIGIVYLRNAHRTLNTHCIERDGIVWYIIEASSPGPFLCITSLILMHRRAWNYYGPYPEGLRIDTMQEEMSWRYKNFENGPAIAIRADHWDGTMPSCIGKSTWDWRLTDDKERKSWHRYRSYGARED